MRRRLLHRSEESAESDAYTDTIPLRHRRYAPEIMKVSNADRIVFPEIGRTKGDVVAYYERVAERMLPHVAGRPVSIRRYPKGLAGPGFFDLPLPEGKPA